MSEEKTDEQPGGLEEQIREMLKRANVTLFAQPRPPDEEAAREQKPAEPDAREDRLKRIREFSLKPRDIRDYLNRFVIRQDEAKEVLSVAICDHYNHVRRCLADPARAEGEEYAKHNIILLGPSGVGKTYLMRCIARLIGVPIVKADATKFSETGYVGHDVDDLARDLVKAADGDPELAQYGIIYLDEIDKIATQSTAGGGKDVSGRGVQINLLKLMEETEVGLFSQTDLIGQMQAVMDMQRGRDSGRRTISTRHILFIVSGAFGTLAEQVKRRVGQSRIGFTPQKQAARDRIDTEYLRLATTRDFIDYGFEPEFVGRLPIRVVCDELSADDLEKVMQNSEGSILTQYRNDFEGYGIGFNVSPEAVRAVAQRAYEEKTGARGLMTILERVFRRYKFELPSTGIRTFDVDEDTIARPDESLAAVLRESQSTQMGDVRGELLEFASGFEHDHGLKLTFSPAAVKSLAELAARGKRGVVDTCREHFHDLPYGLKLVSRNTGRNAFTVTKKLVERPAEELSRLVAASVDAGRSG